MPWMALAVLAGVAGVERLEALTAAALWTSPLTALALMLAFVRPALLVSLSAAVGWAWWDAASLLAEDLDAALEGQDLLITGDIVSLPRVTGGRVQFDLAALEGEGFPDRVRLTWYEPARVPRATERWQFEVRLRPRRGFSNPGGFDYEGQLFRERIGATGYVRDSSANRLVGGGRARPILKLRAAIVEQMESAIGRSPLAGVLVGLAVGHTARVDAETWRTLSVTGTTHLVAISGLHVTLVAVLAMAVARVSWRWWPGVLPVAQRDVAAACGALAALAYAMLAGFSVPTQRTLAMFGVALCAGVLRRSAPATHVLALALLGVVLLDPHSVLTPGFWLSFIAVAAILLAARPERGLLAPVRSFMTTQSAVSVLLLPVTVVLFGSVSLVAPFANAIAIPLFTLVLVPVTFAGVALSWIAPAAGELVLTLALRTLEACWPVMAWLAEIPGALAHPPPPDLLLVGVLVVSAVAALSVLPPKLKLLPLALLLPLFFDDPQRPAHGGFDVTVIDVGQGLAVLVETRARALLYDTGPVFRSGRTAAELAVLPVLRFRAIRQLDRVVVSHGDQDHAGGLPAITREMPVLEVLAGGPSGAGHLACRAGQAWKWDGVSFDVLHPRGGERWSDNDGSCVIRVSGPGGSLLLAGDIETAAEAALIAQRRIAPANVVVVPHHGSRSSSSQPFVEAVLPRLAIVSAGQGNRWRFPHEPVIARWCAAGARVIDTARWGAVFVRFDAVRGVQQPGGQRAAHRRFWHPEVPRPPGSLCPARLSKHPRGEV